MKKKMMTGFFVFGMAMAMLGSSVMAEPVTESSNAVFELKPGGNVAIESVPSFNFGEQMISATTETYLDESTNPSVRISDLRGTEEGWSLSLGATAFKTAEEKQLMGAIMYINGIEIGNPNENISPAPTATLGSIEFGEGEDGAGVENMILNAEEGAGSGEWLGNFYDDSENLVELEVPAGNKVGEYTSTLTWTLSDAPQ